MIKFRNMLIAGVSFMTVLASAQNTSQDSLSLQSIIKEVINNYPALKKAESDIVAIDAKIGLTQTAYLPDISFSASYSRIGPITSISMPINGVVNTFSLYPADSYNATVSVNENIYDFGRTTKNLVLDRQNKNLVLLTVEQTKQKLSTASMVGYYSVAFLQEAINIKTEELQNLQEHLNYIRKKAETGSAINYDITSTKVRISIVENQITDFETSLQVQTTQLNSYMGRSPESPLRIQRPNFSYVLLSSTDSLCNTAFANRNEVKIAKQKEEISKSKLAVVNTQNNPSLNFFASGGFKNGYLNDYLQDTGRLNYVVGVGVKVPIFDANRSKYVKIQTNAELNGNQQETEVQKRNITNEIVETRANVLAAQKKVRQSELMLQQAQQAYDLAQINYKAGTITNLDLLDNFNLLSDSKLSLFKTKIDYLLSSEKLKIATGEKLY